MSDLSSILTKLKDLNKKNYLDIFLPSLGKKVKYNPLTLEQQRTIIGSLPDDKKVIFEFFKIFNDVVIDNNDEVNSDTLNQFDRYSVMLNYRIDSLGNILEKNNKSLDLNNLVNKIEKYDFSKILNETIIEKDSLKIKLSVPSLNYESEINDQFIEIENNDDYYSFIFVLEIAKYISQLSIEDEDINFKNLSLTDKIKVLDQLPVKITKKISKFIDNVKSIENNLFSLDNININLTSDLFSI